MPYQVVHKGVVREFEFIPPLAWPYWWQRVRDESGRAGLPLLIALHGGGQDPATFAANWAFTELLNGPDGDNWEDRCIVLYPHGLSYFPGPTGEPLRAWNPGFGGGFPRGNSDVGFIRAMIAEVERILGRELRELGIDGPAIDPDRRFLFGYSAGGMMAYRLANRMPDYWAALWVQSAAYGGRSHHDLTATVTNPPSGRHGISLFAHHGDEDTVVPPGPRNDPGGLETSDINAALYAAVGLGAADAARYSTSYRHLAAAVLAYRTHNNCNEETYEFLHPPNTGVPGVAGPDTALKATWRQDGDPPNPEVIAYRDPDMNHTNFVPNSHLTNADVWEFFKAHPRVAL